MKLETEQQIKDCCAEQARDGINHSTISDMLLTMVSDEWIADIVADAGSRFSESFRSGYGDDAIYTVCCERWIDDAIAARNEPSQGDINREAAARDAYQRREELKREVA